MMRLPLRGLVDCVERHLVPVCPWTFHELRNEIALVVDDVPPCTESLESTVEIAGQDEGARVVRFR